jgi:RimJ/RimL family protein N-acetyltransferase
VKLRTVESGDVDLYVKMRCDPVMMAELGGPLPREGIDAKVARDVEQAQSGEAWIFMVVCDDLLGAPVAGTVVLWRSVEHPQPLSEIGWMVLPEFQGRGVGKTAVRLLLDRARHEERWGTVHAFPSVSNGPSNGICRAVGFTLAGEETIAFGGRTLLTNHWHIDPRTDLNSAQG